MLRLPHGLDTVGIEWFDTDDIEKVIIPSSVRVLRERAFILCEFLREVVFEPGSQLETIGDNCFNDCGLEKVLVPRSVRSIGDDAFRECRNLKSLAFEEGSQLAHVGKNIVSGTKVGPKKVKFPSTAQIDYEEETDYSDTSVYDHTDSDES